jgi:hypothetical protein
VRLIINLFLIILIVFSLAIIPINYQLLDLDFPYFGDSQETTPDSEESIDYFDISTDAEGFLNDNSFEVILRTTNEEELETLINSFNVTLTTNTGKEKNLDLKDIQNSSKLSKDKLSDFIDEEINEELNKTVFTIEYRFFLKNLDISSNQYSVTINSSDNRVTESINFKFRYLKDNEYVGSSNIPPNNSLFAKVYYPDEEFLRLVPVHEILDDGTNFIRRSIDELLTPADEKYGLATAAAAPNVDNIYISNGTARMDLLSSEILDFNQGSAASQFALNSIINTISEFEIVNDVKFFVDNSDQGDYFHGTDLTEPFKVNDLPKAYVGLETSKKTMFLFPIDIETEGLNNMVLDILSTLRTGTSNGITDHNLIPTLPDEVKVNNYVFDGTNIELYLSGDFLTVYGDSENYQRIMYESILYSLTSIEGINTVSILVDESPVEDFLGINISERQRPNKFINTLN